jgi:hypothetical protein
MHSTRDGAGSSRSPGKSPQNSAAAAAAAAAVKEQARRDETSLVPPTARPASLRTSFESASRDYVHWCKVVDRLTRRLQQEGAQVQQELEALPARRATVQRLLGELPPALLSGKGGAGQCWRWPAGREVRGGPGLAGGGDLYVLVERLSGSLRIWYCQRFRAHTG